MKRRDFLKRAGIGVAASAAFGPVFAQGSPTVRWRMASSFPKSLDCSDERRVGKECHSEGRSRWPPYH